MKARLFIAAALFGAASACVAAEQVYRCGPEGRIYQNKPCEQGKAVDVADPRSAEQQKSARAAAKADARLADELERDRRAREAGTPPARASGFNARPPPEQAASAPAKAKKKQKSASTKAASQPSGFIAVTPQPQKAKPAKP